MAELSPLYIASRKRAVCLRCKRPFRLVDNLGTWHCLQPVPGREDIYVRADHIEQGHTKHYSSPIDDLFFGEEHLDEMRRYEADLPTASITEKLATGAYAQERMLYADVSRVLRFDAAAEQAVIRDPLRTMGGYRLAASYVLPKSVLVARATPPSLQ